MKLTLLDILFVLGVLMIVIPLFVYNWMIGSVVTGFVIVWLSLKIGQKGGDNKT